MDLEWQWHTYGMSMAREPERKHATWRDSPNVCYASLRSGEKSSRLLGIGGQTAMYGLPACLHTEDLSNSLVVTLGNCSCCCLRLGFLTCGLPKKKKKRMLDVCGTRPWVDNEGYCGSSQAGRIGHHLYKKFKIICTLLVSLLVQSNQDTTALSKSLP